MAYTSKFQFDQTNTPIMTEPQQQDYEEDIFELNIEEPVTTSASSFNTESASYYYYDNNNKYSSVNKLQSDLTSPLLTPQHYSRNSSISSVDSALSSTSPSVSSSSSYSSLPHFEFSSPTFYYNNNSNNNINSNYDSSYLSENSIVEKNNELIKNNYKAYLLKLTIPSY